MGEHLDTDIAKIIKSVDGVNVKKITIVEFDKTTIPDGVDIGRLTKDYIEKSKASFAVDPATIQNQIKALAGESVANKVFNMVGILARRSFDRDSADLKERLTESQWSLVEDAIIALEG